MAWLAMVDAIMPDESQETQLMRTQTQTANKMFEHEDLWFRYALRQLISIADHSLSKEEIVKLLKDETNIYDNAA